MNPEEVPDIPQRLEGAINRPLEAADIEIIFRDAGPWWLFYALIVYTGLRCDDVASLTYGDLDRGRGVLAAYERRYRRIREIPMAPVLMEQIPKDKPLDAPFFRTLYVDIEDQSLFEEEMNSGLSEPLDYLQCLLSASGRPIASLHSLTLSHNNLIQGHDLFAPDQLAILAHIASVTLRARRPVILN